MAAQAAQAAVVLVVVQVAIILDLREQQTRVAAVDLVLGLVLLAVLVDLVLSLFDTLVQVPSQRVER
jgi:hypothetical protein